MRVAVVGGGIQGVSIALELSLRGVAVELYEKRDQCLTQASLRNEGKIHLGFVYANDATFATARCMAAGAMQFEGALTRWLEQDVRSSVVSSPFYYYVHRDSLLSTGELADYYNAVTDLHRELAQACGASYFGADPTEPVSQVRSCPGSWCNGEEVAAIFRTPEIAVDTEIIGPLLRQRLVQDPNIGLHFHAKVLAVSHDRNGATLAIDGPEEPAFRTYDHVINASWEDLLLVDRTAGVPPLGPWSFRVKHFLRVRGVGPVPEICSATIALGAFGDVVLYPGGDIFLSWYPVGRTTTSFDIALPSCALKLSPSEKNEIRVRTFQALCRIMPGLRRLQEQVSNSDVNGGVIFAWGNTDVDDRDSRLHERHSVGPRSFGRYHSVNTGKYTLAPMFAKQLADRILSCPAD